MITTVLVIMMMMIIMIIMVGMRVTACAVIVVILVGTISCAVHAVCCRGVAVNDGGGDGVVTIVLGTVAVGVSVP